MESRSTKLPPDLDDAVKDAIDYPEENISGYIRDAVRLRLLVDNDREILEANESVQLGSD